MRAAAAAPALLVLLVGCGKSSTDEQQQQLLEATIVFPPRDTIRFAASVTTHRCTDPRTLLLEAVNPEGNGVLVRLHSRDTIATQSYRIVLPGDSSVGSAVVAVRYLLRETPRQFMFDTGMVRVTRSGAKIGGQIQGSGTESAIRAPTRITYHDVPLPRTSDSAISCAFRP